MFFLFFCDMKKPEIYWIYIIVFVLLSTPKLTAHSATVQIEQESSLPKLMATNIEVASQDYAAELASIQLFYGDNKRAQELFENFKQSFPDWEVDLSFETPNYKVQVGRFKDYYLGLNKLKEIKRVYPAAFLLEIKD